MKRILVTGAGGFIGTHLVHYLKEQGHFVRGVDLKLPSWSTTQADEFWLLDLCDLLNAQMAVMGMDQVYALAADMGGIGYISDPEQQASIMYNNTMVNFSTLEAARRMGVRRYLFTSSVCFPKGVIVMTERGATSIEDIISSDNVITHTGKLQKVVRVFKRYYEGQLSILNMPGLPDIQCTPDHRFLTEGDGWKKAVDLVKGDRLVIPRPKAVSSVSKLRLNLPLVDLQYAAFQDALPGNLSAYSRDKGISYSKLWRWKHRERPRNLEPICKREVEFNENCGELIGLFLAEGWVEAGGGRLGARPKVVLAFGNEEELIQRARFLFNIVFGTPLDKIRVHRQRGLQKGYTIQIVSTVLSDFFSRLCYNESGVHRAWTKSIAPSLMRCDDEFLSGLVRGFWLGDGHVGEHGGRIRISAASTSVNLAFQLRMIMLRLGIYTSVQFRNPSIGYISGRKIFGKKSYCLYVVGHESIADMLVLLNSEYRPPQLSHSVRRSDEVFTLRIASISAIDYKGFVYNLEVEKDNSYTVYGVAVHNCVYPTHKLDKERICPLQEHEVYPARPQKSYGWEKLQAEHLCQCYQACGMETRVVRLQNTYGRLGAWRGGREKAPAAICRKVAEAKLSGNHRVEIWGDGKTTRSFMCIADCIRGLHTVMNSNCPLPVTLGPDRVITIDRLVDIIAEIAGIEIEKVYIEGPQGVRGRNFNHSRAHGLGWNPTVSLEQGLRMTYDWVEDQVRKHHESS